MKETGVLMIDAMRDKAIADLKTQTRRVIIPQPHYLAQTAIKAEGQSMDGRDWKFASNPVPGLYHAVSPWVKCPYGRPGDRLYLKEDVCLTRKRIGGKLCVIANYRFCYEDTGFRQYKWEDLDKATRQKLLHKKTWGRWTSKLLMYKFLARVWFDITDIRVQRLQEISEFDAVAEGCDNALARSFAGGTDTDDPDSGLEFAYVTNKEFLYQHLWDSINADRAEGKYAWNENPWCWAYTFRRIVDK